MIVEVLCSCALQLEDIALDTIVQNSEERVRKPVWLMIIAAVAASIYSVEHAFKFLYRMRWDVVVVWVVALIVPVFVTAICLSHYRLINLLRFWLAFGRKGYRAFGIGR